MAPVVATPVPPPPKKDAVEPQDKAKKTRTKRSGASSASDPPAKIHKIFITAPDIMHSNAQRDGLTHEERTYLTNQTDARRAKLLRGIVQVAQSANVPLRFRVLDSKLPNKANILSKLSHGDCSGKYEQWLNAALKLPIGKYSSPPRKALADMSSWLASARTHMDKTLWGQDAAKDEAIRMLCQWAHGGATGTFALGLQGLPGIGKTCFAQNVLSTVMQRPFTSISLAGISDSHYLLGHSYTYEGAMPGRISEAMREWGVSDGVLYFDELDKVSRSRGDEIANLMIMLTDREQNAHFRDKYFSSFDLDLSRAIIVFSYNDDSQINPVLLDRLNVIRFTPPNKNDKVAIAREHLLPRALRRAGLKETDLKLDDAVLAQLIDLCPDEPGVRGLDKGLERLVNTLLVAIKGSGSDLKEVSLEKLTLPLNVTGEIVSKCVSKSSSTRDSGPSMMYM